MLSDAIHSRIEREPRVITKSIVVISEQMTENYKKYAQSCFIAVDEQHQVNRWHVGGLLGVGRDMEMSLFALVLLKSVDEEHLKGMLKLFFTSC